MSDLAAPPTTRPLTTSPTDPPRPAADGVALGLAVVALATTAILVVVGEFVPPVVGFVVVLALLSVATVRSNSRVLRWIAALVAGVFLALNAPFAIADLQHPEGGAVFVATLVAVLGAAVTAGLAVAAARGRVVPVRRTWMVAGVVVAAGAVLSAVSVANVPVDVAEPGDVEVVAAATAYPARVTVDADADAVLVRNDDGFRHTFVVPGQVAPVEVPANATVRIPLGLATGQYDFLCDVAGHEGMAGVLVVE